MDRYKNVQTDDSDDESELIKLKISISAPEPKKTPLNFLGKKHSLAKTDPLRQKVTSLSGLKAPT